MTLNWNPSLLSCSSSKYIVYSTGICTVFPNITPYTNTTITYSVLNNMTIYGHNCSFSIATEICGNLSGESSDPFLLILKGNASEWYADIPKVINIPIIIQMHVVPDSPVIISYNYSLKTKYVDVHFNETVLLYRSKN